MLALQALYEADSTGHDIEAVYARLLADAASDDPEVAAAGPSGVGRGLVRGVVRRFRELDTFIEDAAGRYPLDTMAVVDRNILRLAIWELLSDESAPVAAVVNEAVELAHRFGGESSPGFINGVLGTISDRIRAGQRPAEARTRRPRATTKPQQE
jgi:N utilization substance protein B